MKRFVSWICVLVLILCTCSNAMSAGVDDKKNELNEVNQDIKKTEEQLKQVREEQKQVISQLQTIENELTVKERQLAEVQKKLEETRNSLQITKEELEEATLAAQEHEKLMGDRLRAMYMTGTVSYLELLLEAKSINDFLDRIQMVKHMVAYDNQILEEMEAYRNRVDEKKMQLEREEQEFVRTEAEVEKQKDEIEQKKQERSQLLAKLEDQEVELKDDLDDLEKTSKDLEKTIQRLLEEQRKKEQQTQYTGGVFTWPVPGYYRITSPFGWRMHPIYHVNKFHSGIDIGSNYSGGKKINIYGQDFVAAADGTVILSQWYGGYGNCVIINHGGGITSLYGHGSQRLVSEGDKVKKGQPVMKIGSTGASTGAHAHFEVRKNGAPVNPLPYLGK